MLLAEERVANEVVVTGAEARVAVAREEATVVEAVMVVGETVGEMVVAVRAVAATGVVREEEWVAAVAHWAWAVVVGSALVMSAAPREAQVAAAVAVRGAEVAKEGEAMVAEEAAEREVAQGAAWEAAR